MSLNRCEQLVFDYVMAHPEERQHWEGKVRGAVASAASAHGAVAQLEGELWAYVVERSAVAEPFRERARREGLARTSMRNLAEHLARMWTPVGAVKRAAAARQPPGTSPEAAAPGMRRIRSD